MPKNIKKDISDKETNEKSKKSSKKSQNKSSNSTTKKNTTKKKNTLNPIKSILSRRRRKTDTQSENYIEKKSLNDIKNTEVETFDKEVKEDLVIKSNVLEYYDLPYRYNETVVKILAQTPSILFVYWDISDSDRTRFINDFGSNFFETTKPVLLIHNKTKNYSFEIEINDFANSWYLRMQEPNCEYEIELGRRNIQDYSKYIYVTSSNSLVSPNDHVLFESSNFEHVKFKNVNTGKISEKNYGSIKLITNISNIYNKNHKVFHFYNKLYKDEVLESKKMFSNPSSGNPTSGMF